MLAEKNYEVNSKIDLGNSFINGQGVGPISKCRYGLFPASYNACEMIAIYNLLLLQGYKGHKFADICREMYPKTWALWGVFGSNVYRLHLYFTKRKIKTEKFLKRDNFFDELKRSGCGIMSFWNAKNPFKGIHTVCIEKTESTYRIYNRYNSKSFPYEYNTIDEIVDNRRFMCGYVIEKAKNI